MILSPLRISEIFSGELNATIDLWDQSLRNPDQLTRQLSRDSYARSLSGNGAALVQRIVAGADEVVGYAPWQRDGVLAIADLPTPQLVSGELIRQIGKSLLDLINPTLEQVLEQISEAVEAFLRPFLDLVTAIPVIGQILNIVMTWIWAVVDLVRLAKQSQAASEAEATVPANVPNPVDDQIGAKAVVSMCRAGDWTPIWLPVSDPVDVDHDYVRGWGCALIAPNGPFAGGRLIASLSTTAHGLSKADPRGFGGQWGVGGSLGFGGIPGYSNDPSKDRSAVHRRIQLSYGAKTIIDTASLLWMPLSNGAVMQAWSQLFGKGPAAWAVDPSLVLTAWTRYVGGFLEALDSGKMCSKITPASRKAIRRFFLRDVIGCPDQDASIEVALSTMPLRAALVGPDGLADWQRSLAATTTVAYCNARTCPPGLRPTIEQRQADLLSSDLVCRVDLGLVPDPVYRAKIELQVLNRGAQCYTASGLQAPLSGPDQFDRSAPRVPIRPAPAAIPRIRVPLRVGLTRSARATGKPRKKSNKAAAAVAGAGVLGALAVLLRNK